MNTLVLLLSPRVLGIKNSFKTTSSGSWKKLYILSSIGFVFWIMMFVLSVRVLFYFQSVEVIGDLLAHHLLAMIFLTFFSLLIFSHIITALSNLYLSSDLGLIHSSPCSPEEIFFSRAVHTMIDSSWMVMVFGMPVLMAYAWVYQPGPGFYLSLLHMGLAMIIIAAGIGILFTMLMVSIFPAQRTRDIIMLLTVFMIVGLYLMFRFLRPERLVDPDAFFSIVQYVTSLKSPDSPYIPTHWAVEVLWGYLNGVPGKRNYFEILLMWSTAGAMIFINLWISGGIYFIGFSKSQEGKRKKSGQRLLNLLIRVVKKPVQQDLASIVDKDIRTFFRDNTQWSQLFLLGALVVVYLYNFSVLPLEKSPIRIEYLQNEISFLNMGLAGFVISAVSVRFIFPAVSSEGTAFWIVRTSPISIKRFLWGKFTICIVPMLVLGETLIIVTNYMLHVSAFMMVMSSVTMFLSIFSIVAMGIGFGAIYPKFNFENIAQVATGFGGLIYMIFSVILMVIIIVIEAGPVYMIFLEDLRGSTVSLFQLLLFVSTFLLVILLNIFVVFKFMKMGARALGQYE